MIITEKMRLRRTQRENEALRAENERLKGLLDYVAMMTDVELPEEGDNDAQPEI